MRGILRFRTMPDHRSAEAQLYRPWYKTRAWQVTRRRQLQEEPLCRMCKAEGRVTAATVVDHITPHKGDRALFFSADNLQALCKRHHDGEKQSEERRGYSSRVGLDGWPTDERHPANAGGRGG